VRDRRHNVVSKPVFEADLPSSRSLWFQVWVPGQNVFCTLSYLDRVNARIEVVEERELEIIAEVQEKEACGSHRNSHGKAGADLLLESCFGHPGDALLILFWTRRDKLNNRSLCSRVEEIPPNPYAHVRPVSDKFDFVLHENAAGSWMVFVAVAVVQQSRSNNRLAEVRSLRFVLDEVRGNIVLIDFDPGLEEMYLC